MLELFYGKFGAQVVGEAVAGDAARSEAQESQHGKGCGACRQAPVREGCASDGGAVCQGSPLDQSAHMFDPGRRASNW